MVSSNKQAVRRRKVGSQEKKVGSRQYAVGSKISSEYAVGSQEKE